MTFVLPIPLPEALVRARGIVPKNDFAHAHGSVTFTPDGGALVTSDLFYNYYRYDNNDDRDLRALVITRLGPTFDVLGVTVLEELAHELTHALGKDGKPDRKSTRLNSSHVEISDAVFCSTKKNTPASQSNQASTT